MPTPTEIADRARDIADGVLAFDMAEWRGWSEREIRNAFSCAIFIIRTRTRGAPQRRALELFRSWLRPDERAQYRRSREVNVVGSEGGNYRIIPATGTTHLIERHGKRWFAKASFCLHPVRPQVPPADVALAHYLVLQTDERAFLREANRRELGTELWNPDYLRRLREARRRRAEEEEPK